MLFGEKMVAIQKKTYLLPKITMPKHLRVSSNTTKANAIQL